MPPPHRLPAPLHLHAQLYWALNEVSRELEDPYLHAPNDLALARLQFLFNERLLAFLLTPLPADAADEGMEAAAAAVAEGEAAAAAPPPPAPPAETAETIAATADAISLEPGESSSGFTGAG